MDDVLEATSDTGTLGKSNKSDLVNQKLTYVSAYGKQTSIEKAHILLNTCISKLQNSFSESEARNLQDLAKFMVKRKK
jgi:geranylgeranyl pyrophosphate synthase